MHSSFLSRDSERCPHCLGTEWICEDLNSRTLVEDSLELEPALAPALAPSCTMGNDRDILTQSASK